MDKIDTLQTLLEVLQSPEKQAEAVREGHLPPCSVTPDTADWSDLPVFSDDTPDAVERGVQYIHSWDETHMLIGLCPDEAEIVPRDYFDEEADAKPCPDGLYVPKWAR